MLFHTWPFFVFLLVVLPVFFALRKTQLWLPWLTLASYFFYGWWNPYYLFLVFYSTLLDYSLVALMDHCPREPSMRLAAPQRSSIQFDDPVLKLAFFFALGGTIGTLFLAFLGPRSVRPTMAMLSVL